MSLLVRNAVGLITVQDLGRPGRMHEALPPGGALVPSMLVRANRAVGNLEGAAAIEVSGRLVVRAIAPCVVASGSEARSLDVDDEIAIESAPSRVTYLAVRGGVDAPIILGGRGAHLSAGIGGLVRKGDRIAIAEVAHDALARNTDDALARDTNDAVSRARDDALASDPHDEIRVVPGPDLDAFEPSAIEMLTCTAWHIGSSSDRVGTRLEGATIPRPADHVEASRPMVIGAIEIPRDGAPIVLGPEHPTTGGYPVIAVVASDDLDAFHSIPLGGSVRFRV